MLPSVTTATSEGYFASLVDLGRPPVVGLVEPARELARIERERAAILAESREEEMPEFSMAVQAQAPI